MSVQSNYKESNLYRVRHSASHLMAEAVLEAFPGAKLAIGPAIEDGFYYDFDLPRPLTTEDLESIEARMRELISSKEAFVREDIDADEAKDLFKDQPYKLELLSQRRVRGLVRRASRKQQRRDQPQSGQTLECCRRLLARG